MSGKRYKNPRGGKYDRCIGEVKRRGSAVNPYAVCAPVRRNPLNKADKAAMRRYVRGMLAEEKRVLVSPEHRALVEQSKREVEAMRAARRKNPRHSQRYFNVENYSGSKTVKRDAETALAAYEMARETPESSVTKYVSGRIEDEAIFTPKHPLWSREKFLKWANSRGSLVSRYIRKKNPRQRAFYRVAAHFGGRTHHDTVPASDMQQAVRVAMSRWRHAGYHPNEASVKARRQNPRYKRSSASVLARGGPLYTLIAQRPGGKRLVYTGAKFTQGGRPQLFKNVAAVKTAAKFLRLKYPILKPYSMYVKETA